MTGSATKTGEEEFWFTVGGVLAFRRLRRLLQADGWTVTITRDSR